MEKLSIRPDRADYSFSASGNEVLRADLDGGSGRYRADVLNASEMVDVNWVVHPDDYQYLWAFYRRVSRGADPFLIDLLLEGTEWVERTAHFMPGSFRLTGRDRISFKVSAQLEVEQVESDADYDSALVAFFEVGRCDMASYVNLFSPIVNTNWPEA